MSMHFDMVRYGVELGRSKHQHDELLSSEFHPNSNLISWWSNYNVVHCLHQSEKLLYRSSAPCTTQTMDISDKIVAKKMWWCLIYFVLEVMLEL